MPEHHSRMSFKMMSFVHETLYGLFRDAGKVLAAAGLQPGQSVLEVGCGPGFFTLPAASIVGNEGSVLALDINPVAVEHVRRKLQASGRSNVRVIQADAAHTDLPGQSFDLAFVFGVGRAIGGMEPIWTELHRLLKAEATLSVEGRVRPPSHLFREDVSKGRMVRFRKVEQTA
jgi:demethylmenaquinone methyltransferase/2-methoxy-6-polyprenyl-1,4-benzoquinol methylase